MLTIKEVASITTMSVEHEHSLLVVVKKGYKDESTFNPYSQKNYQKAWHFGNFNAPLTWTAVEQGWLESRKAEGERLAKSILKYQPKPKQAPAPKADSAQAKVQSSGDTAKSNTFHPDDFKLDHFDWKFIPPGSPFWGYWNDDKYAMKAADDQASRPNKEGMPSLARLMNSHTAEALERVA
jgi:hypothetical protein